MGKRILILQHFAGFSLWSKKCTSSFILFVFLQITDFLIKHLPLCKLTTNRITMLHPRAYREALTRAETLLSSQLGLYRLDNIWGIGGGLRPVKTLSRQMNLLLEEYLSSNDIPEATRCVVALEVPHFHHELVYEVGSQAPIRDANVFRKFPPPPTTTTLPSAHHFRYYSSGLRGSYFS